MDDKCVNQVKGYQAFRAVYFFRASCTFSRYSSASFRKRSRSAGSSDPWRVFNSAKRLLSSGDSIGLCQEGKSSPDALRRSARVQNSFWFFVACVGLSAVVSISNRTRLPFAVSDQRVVLNRRLILCFPASLETNQREHPELRSFRPVGLTARPGRPRVEEILLVHRQALRSDAVRLYQRKIPLPTVHRHEVGHQLPCHRQRRAIGIAFLLFLVNCRGESIIPSSIS
jgi:hypothetical protein